MELSKSLVSDLISLGNTKDVSLKAFEALLDDAYNVDIQSTSSSSETNDDTKRYYLALKTFVTECVRLGSSEEEIRAQLEECEFGNDKIDVFLKKHNSHATLQSSQLHSLQKISSLRHRKIVDVSWRLDYTIKTSQAEKYDKPEYVLEFLTLDQRNGEVKPLTMRCSLEQLQDFVGKLKDATRCVEKQTM